MQTYLQLLTEADAQIETAEKEAARIKFAEVVSTMKDGVDRDFITKVATQMALPHDEVERMLVDFAINYSTIIASTDIKSVSEEDLSIGVAFEKDAHGINDEVAKKLAADNIVKDPNYYKSEEPAVEEAPTEEAPQEEAAPEETASPPPEPTPVEEEEEDKKEA